MSSATATPVVDHSMAVEMEEESGYRYWATMPESEVNAYISAGEARGEYLSEASHAGNCPCGGVNIYAQA